MEGVLDFSDCFGGIRIMAGYGVIWGIVVGRKSL